MTWHPTSLLAQQVGSPYGATIHQKKAAAYNQVNTVILCLGLQQPGVGADCQTCWAVVAEMQAVKLQWRKGQQRLLPGSGRAFQGGTLAEP